jgi:hypothetical protein
MQKQPVDAIFLRWGSFEIAISGKLALLTVIALGIGVFIGRWLSLW